MSGPTVSVVLSVFNGEKYLEEAIQSILGQSYRDFELIIVSEHGTSAESLEIISSFADARILHICNQERLGFIRSLNLALSKVRGRYIARMDGDDVCDERRFERQVRFLEEHRDIAAVGSDILLIDGGGGKIMNNRYPHSPAAIRWEMFFRSAIAHPSAMFRSEIISKVGAYDESTSLAEDYSLWLRILQVSELANIPEPLLSYRVHGQNISTIREEETRSIADDLACDAIADLLGSKPSREAVACLRDRSRIRSTAQGLGASDLLISMHRKFIESDQSSWTDMVRIHAVTIRLQVATSLRFIRPDPFGACRAISRSLALSPSTALPGLLSAMGQLFAYRRKMRKLNIPG